MPLLRRWYAVTAALTASLAIADAGHDVGQCQLRPVAFETDIITAEFSFHGEEKWAWYTEFWVAPGDVTVGGHVEFDSTSFTANFKEQLGHSGLCEWHLNVFRARPKQGGQPCDITFTKKDGGDWKSSHDCKWLEVAHATQDKQYDSRLIPHIDTELSVLSFLDPVMTGELGKSGASSRKKQLHSMGGKLAITNESPVDLRVKLCNTLLDLDQHTTISNQIVSWWCTGASEYQLSFSLKTDNYDDEKACSVTLTRKADTNTWSPTRDDCGWDGFEVTQDQGLKVTSAPVARGFIKNLRRKFKSSAARRKRRVKKLPSSARL